MSADSTPDQVRVHTDRQALTRSVAASLVEVLVDAVKARGAASAVLTGGGTGTGILEALAQHELAGQVDWSRVHLWWGDERFLPAGDAERNEVQATGALLGVLVSEHGLPAGNVHRMPAATSGPSEHQGELNEAARRYTADLQAHAETDPGSDPRLPVFDVVLLGMGPDAHVASLFPDLPGPTTADETVIPVRDSPKPPAERISMTMEALNTARQLWFVVAGEDKAEMVRQVREVREQRRADAHRWPASAVSGTEQTRWELDREAAGLTDAVEGG